MPYIDEKARTAIAHGFDPNLPGELNYKLTREVVKYLGPKPNYQRFNEVIGVLECMKLELYRRMIVPYENKKIQENGDVYPQ